MTAAALQKTSISAVQRPDCLACCRPFGRLRAPLVPGDGLLDCVELIVCDQCWHLAGGTAAIHTRAAANADGQLKPILVFDPAIEAVLAAADEYDQLHPIDRLLVESGVRWATLRHIAVPARMRLAAEILRRAAPEYTRVADSADVWLGAVEDRIRQQSGSGQEFRYNAKRRRWWRICNVLRCCSDQGRRPLTWVTQSEIAATVGCSDRTVRRCVAWLQREALLWEILPGCQLPRKEAPDGESAAERAERERREAEAIAAEDAAIARARAELDAVRAGLRGRRAVAAARQTLELELSVDVECEVQVDEPALVQLAPVYELRVPLAAQELEEADALVDACVSAGDQLLHEHADERIHPANLFIYGAVTAVYASGAHTVHAPMDLVEWAPTTKSICSDCGPVAGYLRYNPLGADLHKHQNVHPPQVCNQDQVKSSSVQPVDNRPASPGRDKKGSSSIKKGPESAAGGRTRHSGGDRKRANQSEAVRAADWLLRSRLHPDLCVAVSCRWLTNVIQASGLLSAWNTTFGDAQADLLDAEWSHEVPTAWNEIADLIHGVPDYPHLPRFIRNAPGWIKARFARADPHIPPSKAKIIRRIESTSPTLQQRRQATIEASRQAEISARRAAIEDCQLCDEYGFFAVDPADPNAPLAKCNHDPGTSGW
ncbi:hypothetical protein [Amycolatopsis sp. cmx-4-61]|uniref:hypothetical protein n=1 Tax=Amycolatopsis sp. cmx-4-61 TaxID=2790937 RepID=UPI00397E06DB